MIFRKMAAFGMMLTLSAASIAALNPISIQESASIPAGTSLGVNYVATYTITSNLPFMMPTPFINRQSFVLGVGEFIITDNCNGLRLAPNQSCTITFALTPQTEGDKLATVYVTFGKNTYPIQVAAKTHSNFAGLLGVNYQPNHYISGSVLNGHDVFYIGTDGAVPLTNVRAELKQLKAAGFNTVRSYQTVEYAWIEIINQASDLGMNVVYEASIPQNGSNADIVTAVNVLNNVIDAVGASTFNSTVILLFAGHENYSSTDISYLTSAITQLQSALAAKGVTNVPVGSAVVSGNLVTPSSSIANDMATLGSTYSSGAPWGFDPYPFQWGVTPPNQAVTNSYLTNSIAWDYAEVIKQSFYQAPRTIFMAETGWATSGVGTYAGYFCATNNNCAPSVANAGAYLTALYTYVANIANNAGALVFEAYDEPAKDPVNSNDAENFYGVFDQNCNQKALSLLPNQSFSIAANPGCRGVNSGALLTFSGNPTSQSAFTITVTSNNNPVTGASNITVVEAANTNHSNPAINPWPFLLLFDGANLNIRGNADCNIAITVAGGKITAFTPDNCGGMNCNATYQTCFLPNPF